MGCDRAYFAMQSVAEALSLGFISRVGVVCRADMHLHSYLLKLRFRVRFSVMRVGLLLLRAVARNVSEDASHNLQTSHDMSGKIPIAPRVPYS
jgi:hypothetical protein